MTRSAMDKDTVRGVMVDQSFDLRARWIATVAFFAAHKDWASRHESIVHIGGGNVV